MWTTIVIQPIFNLLVLIYALIPGHNLGLAIIIFTVIIRLILWPLVKKQLHQTRVMRELQPQIKQIKAKTKGNRQEESKMMMELYKERGVSPFGSIGVLIIQLPILIGLYEGIRKVVADPHQIIQFAYPVLQHLPWLQHLSDNIHLFDGSLFGFVDLTRSAIGSPHGFYLPAFILVALSAIVQYFQSQQLMPTDKNSRGLKEIMKSAGEGKKADSSELNAAIGKSTKYLIPGMVFIFTVGLASALSLYFLVSGLVAWAQQGYILRQDEEEMEVIANKPDRKKKKKSLTEKLAEKAAQAQQQTNQKPSAKKNNSEKTTTSQSDIIEGEILAKKAKKKKSKAGKRKRKKR